MSDERRTTTNLPRNLMLALSIAQGLALLFLWRALDGDTWLARTPPVNFPLWTAVLVWPTMLLLSIESHRVTRIITLVSIFTGVLVLLAIYVGFQATPQGEFPIESLVFVGCATLTLACFKALMYLQQRAARVPMTYDILFTYSWRNFLIGALAGTFVCGVGIVLALWAALFDVIDIDFFSRLFTEDWFLFPVLSFAFGLGVLIFRNLTGVIDSITHLLEGLIRLLLPLVVGVAAIFLATLAFTGLSLLWGTGSGTVLLLWLNALVLFFVNAVYQNGKSNPYSALIHRLLYFGICLLPIVSALALYGLYLRLAQYGWTVERCWAFVVWALLAMFSVGYTWGIVRLRFHWPQSLARVNTNMGLIVLALMLLVNSPLLDFRSISLASQLARVENGEIELKEFDFYYAKQYLARPAYLEMQALIEQYRVSDPELVQLIKEPGRDGPFRAARAQMWAHMEYRPKRFEIPAALRTSINDIYIQPGSDLTLLQLDMSDDNEPEYVLLVLGENGNYVTGHLFFQEDNTWRSQTMSTHHAAGTPGLDEILRTGEIATVAPRFHDLRIGELVLEAR